MHTDKALDLDAVRAFVLAADLQSFTRAAEMLDTSQASVSLKLKRLETRLGYRLLERTPRQVSLTPNGAAFIDAARDLLLAHERATAGPVDAPARRLTLGISDHVAGPGLPDLLGRLATYDPLLRLEVRIAASRDLMAAYDGKDLDAAIVRREGGRRGGELLTIEPLGWYASPRWSHRDGSAPLRLATMASPCGVRAVATRALDKAGVPWTEVFVGGGVLAVAAAVSAGLAVAAMAHAVAPPGAVEIGSDLGLPRLPASEIVMHSRAGDPRSRATLRAVAAAFRGRASQPLGIGRG